jgi:hypothetical protein
MSTEGKGWRVKTDHNAKEGACHLEQEQGDTVNQLMYLSKQKVRASGPETQTFVLLHIDWLID